MPGMDFPGAVHPLGLPNRSTSVCLPEAKWRAKAVLPHCLGQSKAAIRLRVRALSICSYSFCLSTHILEIITTYVGFSRKKGKSYQPVKLNYYEVNPTASKNRPNGNSRGPVPAGG